MRNKIKHMLPLLMISSAMQAQMPSTDIFTVDMKINKDGIYQFSTPVNITKREGYDNQPAFSPTGKIYYTSLRDSSGTDTYMYDPVTGKDIRITKTSESEYSPTMMPGNKELSVVRVDKDSAQRLYQVTLDGKTSKLLLKGEDSIGYHCWMNNKKIALFILGDTASLRIVDMNTQEGETAVTHIGRCIARIPGTEQISFVEKQTPHEWYIKSYNPETKKAAFLIKTLDDSEDYVWTPDKKILMGKNGKLFICDPFQAVTWKEIADFTNTTGPFYRLAINADGTKLALVNYSGTKP